MGTVFRRGFKAAAERQSLQIRNQLNLKITDRLECAVLARYLGIRVVSIALLERNGASLASIERLRRRSSGFSAATICGPEGERLIVYNPNESNGRHSNSIAHELSHVILKHPLTPALGTGGCRRWDSESEAEADWLAGALLVPREGALHYIFRACTYEKIAKHFGVSLQLLKWRIRMTGIEKQLYSLRQSGKLISR